VASARLPDEGEMPSLDGATGWLNSPPLTSAGLRGKPVLVSFWTYTCINWLRQLPYLRAWAGKYSGHGLAVIGVHTPEFSFEHNPGNIRQAVQDMRITYPVATDNDYAVWRAFGNHYWPALYFADAQGRVRHHHFGEGESRKWFPKQHRRSQIARHRKERPPPHLLTPRSESELGQAAGIGVALGWMAGTQHRSHRSVDAAGPVNPYSNRSISTGTASEGRLIPVA
jgi:thiol-disulfide isomerase/thioredoxin